MKKLTKVEKFLLENEGANYKSYRCAVHGVFQIPKCKEGHGQCGYAGCTAAVETITDAVAYAKAN